MHKILIAMILAVAQVAASPIPDFPFTAVNGSAFKEVTPDKATVKFTVLCHDSDSEVAVATVNKVLRKVTDEILALGIRKEDIVADDLSKEAVREKREDLNQLKILGYDVSRDVKITVPEIDRYTKLVRLIMSTDNITKVSSDFDTSKRDEIEIELIASACADAKKKAELLCKGVGTELGDVFAVSDQNFDTVPRRFGFGYYGAVFDTDYGDEAEAPVFVPAKIEIWTSVNVLYRLGSEAKREQDAASDR